MRPCPPLAALGALLLAFGCAATRPAGRGATPTAMAPVLPFLHDDYPGALALARSKQVPIFVETWAPW